MDKVMAVNAGSSSLKFKLYEMPEEKVLCSGNAERIGHEDAIFGIKWGGESEKKILPILDHAAAVHGGPDPPVFDAGYGGFPV